MNVAVPPVVVVIVTHNARQHIGRCLESLRPALGGQHYAIVVDNDSKDGTAATVRALHPSVEVIQTEANLGYAGGNNRGIGRAKEVGADYVLILNPDTEVVHPEFVDELVTFMEANPDVGIAGPRVFLRDRTVVQNTVLTAPSLWRNSAHWLRYRLNRNFAHRSGDTIIEAEVLNGVCLVLRMACLHDIGLFDENIFAYLEDTDLDFRARQRGWKIMYLPVDSVIHHQVGGAYGMTSLVSFLLRRNTVYYLVKIGRNFDAWSYAIVSLGLMFIRGILPRRTDTFRGHVRFCWRLARAYHRVLLCRPLDEAFGPPYGSWPVLGGARVTGRLDS